MTTLFETMSGDMTLNLTNKLQEDYILSLVNNLELLLNSRKRYLNNKNIDSLKNNSLLLNYGLANLGQFNPKSATDQLALQSSIKQAIEFYEPRLQDVNVSLLESSDPLFINLHFKIEAVAHCNEQILLFHFMIDPLTHQSTLRVIQ